MTSPPLVACYGCRGLVPDGDGPTHPYLGASPGCWAEFGRLSAASFETASARAVWPLAVDAYAVQHPGVPGRRSSQSVWVHLVSLCLTLEHGWSPQDGIAVKRMLLEEQHEWSWLGPPADPGLVTVLDVAAVGLAARTPAIERWADAVWTAWQQHHVSVRERAERLLRDGR